MTGKIYFIAAEGLNAVKIGFTADVLSKRLIGLQTGCPNQLVILAHTPGGKRDEQAIHAHFAKARIRGEWFAYKGGLDVLLSYVLQEQIGDYIEDAADEGWETGLVVGERISLKDLVDVALRRNGYVERDVFNIHARALGIEWWDTADLAA